MKLTKANYERHLNDQGMPESELAVNGGRCPHKTTKYGSWLRVNDPTDFAIGFSVWVRENTKRR